MNSNKENTRVRFMRLVVFFDLPVLSAEQRKDYRKFRKYLINEGYLMMQESVYSKLVTNNNTANAAVLKLKNNKPREGLVQVLRVTEKQYATMDYIVGTKVENHVDDTLEDFVVL